MGEVYRARDTRLERDVAINVLPAAIVAGPDRLARFEREARIVAALNHPHIAAIYGVEERDGVQGLVLELVEGDTLSERLSRVSRTAPPGLPVGEALEYARQIARALEAAHAKGIVHRDLKPGNIKITPDGAIKLLDFGIAKMISGDSPTHALTATSPAADATHAGAIVGTAAYMSPQQARGEAVDNRADIWAFGCVVYEMLTGRSPFARATLHETLAAVCDEEPDWKSGRPIDPGEYPLRPEELPREGSGATPPRHRVSPPSDRRRSRAADAPARPHGGRSCCGGHRPHGGGGGSLPGTSAARS